MQREGLFHGPYMVFNSVGSCWYDCYVNATV